MMPRTARMKKVVLLPEGSAGDDGEVVAVGEVDAAL
jgi:hypothetical protein